MISFVGKDDCQGRFFKRRQTKIGLKTGWLPGQAEMRIVFLMFKARRILLDMDKTAGMQNFPPTMAGSCCGSEKSDGQLVFFLSATLR